MGLICQIENVSLNLARPSSLVCLPLGMLHRIIIHYSNSAQFVLFVRSNHSEKAWKSFGSVAPSVTCWVTTLVIFGSRRYRGQQGGGDLCHWTQLLAHFSSSDNFEEISDRHCGDFSSWLKTFMGEYLIVILIWSWWGYLYCWDPREVRGAKPGMKKWSLCWNAFTFPQRYETFIICCGMAEMAKTSLCMSV